MTDDRPPIDWPHVLGDIAAEFGEPGVPLGTRGLAHVLRVSRGTVRNILDTGTEPAHSAGVRWISLWCLCMSRTESEIPRKAAAFSAAKAG